jgi:hypothetical protein
MASSSPRQLALLAGLLAVLAAVLFYNRSGGGTVATTQARNARSTIAPDAAGVEPVHLDRLEALRPGPDGNARNLFRFGRRSAGPPAPVSEGFGGGADPTSRASAPVGAAAPPPARAIGLKFIGVVEPASSGTLAVLSDGRNVFYGREGDTIEGRYRIDRIGVESIEMSHLDGGGRQVIRLSGS